MADTNSVKRLLGGRIRSWRSTWRLTSLGLLLAATLAPPSAAAAPPPHYKIVTASERGTYIEIGRDLAKWVATPAGIDLAALPSSGSAENVRRMRREPGVKFALVQSDVYQAFLDQAKAGNAEAGELIRPLRLILPLYDEEIYFVTRADSPLTYIHEIRNKRIGAGPIGSGTALTSATLYKLMFDEAMPPANAQYISNEDALFKLTVEKSIDVAVIVAGQPAKLFAEMKPEARKFIKILRLDAKAPETGRAIQTYFPATIRAESYPTWLGGDVPTLTVKAFLVTYDYEMQATSGALVRFADSLCTHFGDLQANGHPKWKQVRLELPPLAQGWRYYTPMEQRLRACINGTPAPAPKAARVCTEQERVLGLCKK